MAALLLSAQNAFQQIGSFFTKCGRHSGRWLPLARTAGIHLQRLTPIKVRNELLKDVLHFLNETSHDLQCNVYCSTFVQRQSEVMKFSLMTKRKNNTTKQDPHFFKSDLHDNLGIKEETLQRFPYIKNS